MVIVLDALREDTVAPPLELAGRCIKAETCIASAPWTLPSCTSLLTGLDAPRHRHYWHSGGLAANRLMEALPSNYRKVGLVNNAVMLPASQLNLGFDRWKYFGDHERPFERAKALLRRARTRRPLFLLLHSNIPHDYYLPGATQYYDEMFPDSPDRPCVLGPRVINWNETTSSERVAVKKTYETSAMKAVSCTLDVLELARARDDFVSVVVSDHGEGLDFDHGRVHHGGRLHDDLLRVPLYLDLPSTIRETQRAQVTASFTSDLLVVTDVLPTIFSLAGIAPIPDVDGRQLDRAGDERIAISEDRRYLYLKDRFRVNFKGRGKNMSDQDRVQNNRLVARLTGPPVIRSYRSRSQKLIVTTLEVRSDTDTRGGARSALLDLADRLLGSPALVLRSNRMFAFELYDLEADPEERDNVLLRGDPVDALAQSRWGSSVTLPADGFDGAEDSLRVVLEAAELVDRG